MKLEWMNDSSLTTEIAENLNNSFIHSSIMFLDAQAWNSKANKDKKLKGLE